ncbi:hypothetical protein [Streptacidiphilus carbonis]|jgi:hypothetical protein|uniref:hypothetical protein n=1 Tax=Streptacidiphilus carbonis TaxID=105422 RepID=UPI0005A6DC19|nr:hypothetical protein [Streptacidiphilus carbonis]
MLLLGLLIVGATIAFTTVVIADNLDGGPHYSATLFGHHLATVNTLGAFLAGMALALVFCLAMLMVSAGARRERRRNAELRTARRERRAAARAADADTAAPVGTATGEEDTVTRPVLTKGRPRGVHLFGH